MQHFRMLAWTALVVLALASMACGGGTEAPPPPPPAEEAPPPAPAPVTASATLQSRADMSVGGMVTLTQTDAGVEIVAEVGGVAPGKHGFHIHETGDCSAEDFTSAGGHFNPGGTDHAGPAAEAHHAGDLGNIEVGEDGSGRLEVVSTLLTLDDGEMSAVGKAVILHEGEDDLASQPTGAAGGRLACGVIELDGADAAAEDAVADAPAEGDAAAESDAPAEGE